MTDQADTQDDVRKEQFEKTWKAPTGFQDWFKSVNNQPFGNRFMGSAVVFFFLAGILALLMRLQLAFPENDLIGPDVYNQLFTMHGSTMMYLVMLPFLEGLAIYLLPLIIGSREMAYPRMSAFSFWVFFGGGLIFFTGFLFNAVPDTGWFVYPPISLTPYSGMGVDFLLVGLGFIEIAGIGTGIEIVASILKFRAPGMNLGRMPIFAWAWLVTGVMIIFAFATLFGATVLIELDRAAGTRFFDPTGGGNSLLWQHLFWFFGHPDVYIMFIPATGIISMIVPTFARRPIAGYTLVVVAILLTGFMSFGLWVHHMFTTGLPDVSMGFFIAASIMIALASGTQVFAWIATLWRSRPALKSPMLFVLGFLFIFVLGGITGVMVAVLPFDLQAHDTYFVVAHFHYVLIGGVVFPILAGVHYYLPLIIGKMPSERLAHWSFWLIFIGFNVAFFPMHASGLKGMARRVYTYSESLDVGWLNLISTAGSYVLGIGFVLVAVNVFLSRKSDRVAERNPWGSGALEWSVTSEMPNYVFARPPVIYNREPLREQVAESERDSELEELSRKLDSAPAEWRASLITDVVTARPQAIQRVAGPTYTPIIAAIGMFIASVSTLFKSYLLAAAALIGTLIVVAWWLWPEDREIEAMRESGIERLTGLTLQPTGTASSGWWAMVGTLATIGTIVGVLVFSYLYLWLYSPVWPQGEIPDPELAGPAWMYAPLLATVLTLFLAGRSNRKGQARSAILLLLFSGILALTFFALMLRFLAGLGFTPQENAYGSIFYTFSGAIALLALGSVGFPFAAAIRTWMHRSRLQEGYLVLQLQITALYGYFTAVVGVLAYLVLHVSPRLL